MREVWTNLYKHFCESSVSPCSCFQPVSAVSYKTDTFESDLCRFPLCRSPRASCTRESGAFWRSKIYPQLQWNGRLLLKEDLTFRSWYLEEDSEQGMESRYLSVVTYTYRWSFKNSGLYRDWGTQPSIKSLHDSYHELQYYGSIRQILAQRAPKFS